MNPLQRTLHPRTRLALLNTLRQQKGLAKGFTLIELMITVAVVGLLAAVALPAFLGARDSAEAGARIGEQIGLAKECATFVVSNGVGSVPTVPGCTVTGGGTFSATFGNRANGVRCINQTVNTGNTKATVSVTGNSGSVSCAVTNS